MAIGAMITYNRQNIANATEDTPKILDCNEKYMTSNVKISLGEIPDSVFNNNSWSTIKKAVNSGTASSYWKVGDRKAVTLNGTVGKKRFSNTITYCYILGFDHNTSVESNGEHTIHIGFGASALSGGAYIAYCDSQYYTDVSSTGYFSMNSSNIN